VSGTAAGRQASAAARRSRLEQVRAAVRMHLAYSHERREELSRALLLVRQGLREVRQEVRMKLRKLATKAGSGETGQVRAPRPASRTAASERP